MDRVDVAIIGAGVVGLSIAAHVTGEDRSVLLVERHESFGREASSRNSEVIHASIYYPQDSLKGTLCRRGNELMYALCRRHGIPHRNMGKLVVAVTEEEARALPSLLEIARGNGAAGVRLVDGEEARRLDPNVRCVAAMHCPSSGVVDSHALMQHFRAVALNAGAAEAYGVTLRTLEKVPDGFRLGVEERTGTRFEFEARVVVNAAGMGAGEVAALAGIDQDEARYRIHYRKGMYFRVMHGIAHLPRC